MKNKNRLIGSFRRQYAKRKFSLLLIGRTGVGKSSTVNSLMGEQVAEVSSFQSVTKNVVFYECSVHGIPFIVVDTPGLSDDIIESRDTTYLNEIKNTVNIIDCMWYVSPIDEPRIRRDELMTMRLVSESFGADVWKRAIIVFTFADRVDKDEYQEVLQRRSQLIRRELSTYIGFLAAKGIPTIAVANGGSQGPLDRPDGTQWISELFSKVVLRVANDAAIPFFLGLKSRVMGSSEGDESGVSGGSETEERSEGESDLHDTADTAMDFVRSELQHIYDQSRAQSQLWFRFSLAAAVLGFIIVTLGIGFLLVGGRTEAIVTLLASVIPSVAAGLFFKQSQAANERIDTIRIKLDEARKLQSVVDIARTIVDSSAQDKLKSEIVRSILAIKSNTTNS